MTTITSMTEDEKEGSIFDALSQYVQKYKVKVKFTKVDGSERVMLCTTNPKFIPAEHTPKNADDKKNPDLLKVFDLEAQGWRSIRRGSIMWHSIKFNEQD